MRLRLVIRSPWEIWQITPTSDSRHSGLTFKPDSKSHERVQWVPWLKQNMRISVLNRQNLGYRSRCFSHFVSGLHTHTGTGTLELENSNFTFYETQRNLKGQAKTRPTDDRH